MESITRKEFQDHCEQNENAFNEVIPVIKKLAPLAELVPTLKESAELTNATRKFTSNLTTKAKKFTIWVVLITSCLLLFKQVRDFLIEVLIRFK